MCAVLCAAGMASTKIYSTISYTHSRQGRPRFGLGRPVQRFGFIATLQLARHARIQPCTRHLLNLLRLGCCSQRATLTRICPPGVPMQATCDVVPLSSDQDYRRLLGQQAPPLQPLPEQPASSAPAPVHPSASFFYPLGPAAAAAMEQQWRNVTGQAAAGAAAEQQHDAAERRQLAVMFGRNLHVVRQGRWGNAGRQAAAAQGAGMHGVQLVPHDGMWERGRHVRRLPALGMCTTEAQHHGSTVCRCLCCRSGLRAGRPGSRLRSSAPGRWALQTTW